MTLYVIARPGENWLESPVFHAGPNDEQEALAVFTELGLAQAYLQHAGWTDQYEVGELRPIQILRWYASARDEGSDLVAINPDRAAQQQGEPQRVVPLNEPLAAFADTLRAKLEGTESTSGPHPIQHAIAQQSQASGM